MPKWRIYYSDGSTFDSEQGVPHKAPTEGFICAVGFDSMGRRYIQHSYDFYCWNKTEERWWGVNVYGLHDLLRRNELYAYKEGRTVPTDTYKRILNEASYDPDFPHPNE